MHAPDPFMNRPPAIPLPHPRPDVVFCPVDDGAVLLSTADEIYFGLNAVGARIWELLPPTHDTLDQLVAVLAAEYPDVAAGAIRADAEALLAELLSQRLVTPAPHSGSPA